MGFTKFLLNVLNIQALNDRPNANTGLTADQVKSAFDQAGSDIKDYINNTLTPELDSNSGLNLGLVNVMSYYGSGLSTTAAGSITTGTKLLTLTTTPDFVAGQGINLQGVFEVASLEVTAGPSSSANCTVTLNGVAKTVALTSGNTTTQVATAIRAATFPGWTTGGSGTTVTFTSNTTGTKTDASYSAGTTGATGTMTTTTQGTADQISTVSSVSGLVVTIADNSTRTIAAGTIYHDDTVALNAATTSIATAGGGTIRIPRGTYRSTSAINVPSNTILDFDAGANVINSTDGNIFTHTSDSANANITIRNANIEGNHNGSAQYAIYFSGVANVKIEGCTINYTARGMRFPLCTNISITRNAMNFNGFTSSSADQSSILLETGTYGIVSNNQIFDGTGIGVHLLGANDTFVFKNTIWRCSSNGVRADGGIHYRVIASENNIRYCGNASNLTGADSAINFHGLTDGMIINNVIDNNYFYGIDITGTQGVAPAVRVKGLIISGNTITNNGDVGLIIFDAKYTNVVNNLIKTNKIDIKVDGSSAYINLIDNQCYDTTGSYTIHLNSGDRIRLSGNVLGEIDSVVTTIMELRVETAATNVVMGFNDFSLGVRSAGCVFFVTRANVKFECPEVFVSDEITLSGSAYNSPIPLRIPATKSMIFKAYIVYTEAASIDAGVVCGVGCIGETNTFYGTITTAVSATKGTVADIAILNSGQLNSTDTKPYFYCAGGKTGLGKVKIVIEYVPTVPAYN